MKTLVKRPVNKCIVEWSVADDMHWSQQFALVVSWPVDPSPVNTQEHSDPITWRQKQFLGLKAI